MTDTQKQQTQDAITDAFGRRRSGGGTITTAVDGYRYYVSVAWDDCLTDYTLPTAKVRVQKRYEDVNGRTGYRTVREFIADLLQLPSIAATHPAVCVD